MLRLFALTVYQVSLQPEVAVCGLG
ncbi:uncharacterized protein METZ01_LOCUS106538 [marine metagenome]|uniref:Uncharacterized protein n=1 Tax=marine metagenome TaxID=408172 RepID=A0A381WMG6_9ZZZZ